MNEPRELVSLGPELLVELTVRHLFETTQLVVSLHWTREREALALRKEAADALARQVVLGHLSAGAYEEIKANLPSLLLRLCVIK